MKYISLLAIVFFVFSNNSKADVINEIIIENNKRISLGTIQTYGDIKIGEDYSDDDINLILKNLYETSFFENIELKFQNNILTIYVVENKLIQTLIINGVKSLSVTERILESLILKEKSPFIESKVETDVNRIKAGLNFQGYYFANVVSSIVENTNNTVDLIYTIDLGDKAKISRIEFTGNKVVKDRHLRNLITTEESRFWKFLSKKIFLNKDNLLRDERLLKQFYLNEGYYDVVINTSTANLLDDKSFNVTYNIDAGVIYNINETKLILPIDYDPQNFTNINKLLDDLKNKKYSFNKISKTKFPYLENMILYLQIFKRIKLEIIKLILLLKFMKHQNYILKKLIFLEIT